MLVIYAIRGFEAARIFYETLKDKDECEYSFMTVNNKKNKKEKKIIYKINAETRKELISVYEYLSAYASLKHSTDETELMSFSQKFNFSIAKIFSLNKPITMSNEKGRKVWIFYLLNNMVTLGEIVKSVCLLSRRKILNKELSENLLQKIKDERLIQKEKLHPLKIFTAYKIYKRVCLKSDPLFYVSKIKNPL